MGGPVAPSAAAAASNPHTRALMKLTPYDGTGCLEAFLEEFGQLARHFSWKESDMFHHLCFSLEGDAGEVIWDLPPEATTATVIGLLNTRFGRTESATEVKEGGPGIKPLQRQIVELKAELAKLKATQGLGSPSSSPPAPSARRGETSPKGAEANSAAAGGRTARGVAAQLYRRRRSFIASRHRRQRVLCRHCGKRGHCSTKCWNAPATRTRQVNNVGRRAIVTARPPRPPPTGAGPCAACSQSGHWARDCPRRHQSR